MLDNIPIKDYIVYMMKENKRVKQAIPRIILFCWECPYCGQDTDLEAGVIYSHIHNKTTFKNDKYGRLIQECDNTCCGKESAINYDEVDW